MSKADFLDRPNEQTMKTLKIEWETPERDRLGNYCTVRGRLTVAGAAPEQRRPVDWFQGITVSAAKSPDTKLDWSHGTDQADTISEPVLVNSAGRFEATFDLREMQGDRDRAQVFQFGIALAQHQVLSKRNQRVEWNSQDPVTASSVQMLSVPPAEKLSVELDLINRAAGWPDSDSSGVDLIRAVNALQRLGKEQALGVLEEYLRISDVYDERYEDDRVTVFWIVRLLFEPIQLGDRIPFPEIFVNPTSFDPAEAVNWPLDPIALVDDVPFLLARGGNFSGSPELPSNHIRWARQYGVIRDEPLKPTTNPLMAAERLTDSERSRRLGLETVAVADQVVAMLDGIVPPLSNSLLDAPQREAEWQERLRQLQKLKIEWDAKTERFVVRD